MVLLAGRPAGQLSSPSVGSQGKAVPSCWEQAAGDERMERHVRRYVSEFMTNDTNRVDGKNIGKVMEEM